MGVLDLSDRYLLWKLVRLKHAFEVTRFDSAFIRRRDASLAGLWPDGVYCVLKASRGSSLPILPDSLWNADGQLLVSPRLQRALARAALPDVEYWPVKVIDPTGRPVGEPFFFVHLLNAPDCLDLEASGATRSRILPEIAEKAERLAFRNDPERPLCRPKTFRKITLIRWPLAEALAQEGFSGVRFMGLFDYGIKGDLPPHPGRSKVDALCARLSAPRG